MSIGTVVMEQGIAQSHLAAKEFGSCRFLLPKSRKRNLRLPRHLWTFEARCYDCEKQIEALSQKVVPIKSSRELQQAFRGVGNCLEGNIQSPNRSPL